MNEMFFVVCKDAVFLLLVTGLAVVVSKWFYKIYCGKRICTAVAFSPVEDFIYRLMRIDPDKEMNVKTYSLSVILFSVISIVFSTLILKFQNFLFLNPANVPGMSWHLAFNTAASFVTNTNWQAYSGETQASYLSQMLVFMVQNFVSGAVGICVLFALFRGFTGRTVKTVGNFWRDLVQINLYIMIPLCFVGALLLVSHGVPQTFAGPVDYTELCGDKGTLFLGPAASQIIIKQLFTNGGGFWGVNSAFPFENPTPFSNLIECISIILIPVALCFTFGKAVKDLKQGRAVFATMTVIFVICLAVCTVSECGFKGKVSETALSLQGDLPDGADTGVDKISGVPGASFEGDGNLEGKESRFGADESALWAVTTTAASNGSVNSMHDSFTPLGGMIPIFMMMLGEVIYGGVGCGLYGMLAFVLLTVFIAGLMIGRTPEYLGKKLGVFDMKMVCLIILTPVVCILLGTALTVFFPETALLQSDGGWLTNSGAHGFSEILYAYTSQSGNNGSAFAGFGANNPWVNISGGIIMILCRFVPMIAVLFLASSLAGKKIVPKSSGTLVTDNALFVGLTIAVVLVVGALSFFPALSLGPLAEFFD